MDAPDDRFRRLIENSQVGLYQTGVGGEIRWVNEAAARIVGYPSAAEFLASVSDIREIYVDPQRRTEFELEAERTGVVRGFEYEIRRPDGSNRWITVSAIAMRDEDGSVAGFEGSVIDITQTKLLQAAAEAISSQLEPAESVQSFAEVLRRVIPFRQLSLAVIEQDHYRRLVSVASDQGDNPLPPGEWVPLVGNSMIEAVGARKPVVVKDTSAGLWPFDLQLAEAGVASYAIFPLLDDDDVFATFNVGMAVKDGFDDKVLDLLGKHTSSVAQAVKNILLYERQRETVERLTELDRLKNEFFAEVAHDLRHPLTVIMGIAETLATSWDAFDEGKKKDLLDMVARSAQNLADLLDRDLDVALIESGELSFEIADFDLGPLIEEVVGSFRSAHHDRTIDVEIESALPPALGDARRQMQILQNLLSNADKFSPPERPIRVSAGLGDGNVVVSVMDHGGGIENDQKERLFERLSRFERTTPGSGLGLYIVRSMVEAQGGRIWVDSERGEGATFRYTIPLSETTSGV